MVSHPRRLHSHRHENIKSHQLKIYDGDIINNISVLPGYSTGQWASFLTRGVYRSFINQN
jgi:hypothetical protein